MIMTMTRRVALFASAGLMLGSPAWAQADYPGSKVVTIVVPFAAGGTTDLLGRILAERLGARLNGRFIVENRAGAGGNTGVAAVARGPQDGTMLTMGTVSTHAINPAVYARLPFDHVKDFAPISQVASVPNILMVNVDLPAKTVPELIDLLKKNPGKYNYAVGGAGTTPHLCGEMFKTRAGVDMPVVTYRGGAPALIDLMAGRVHVMFDNFSGPIGTVRQGKARGLAVSSPERSPSAPELPALAEFLPGFDITSWNGVVGPAGLPPAMVERMNALTKEALQRPEVLRHYGENGATTWWTTPEAYKAYRREQARILAEVVKTSGAKVE